MNRGAKDSVTKTCSILLVDDFEDGLGMYEEYLTYRGFHVVVARSGEEAVAQARLHRPDVILLDLRMPGMTGTEAMRLLRADSSFVTTLIIALTAHALDDERRHALSAGFDAVIAKPCLPDALVADVQRLMTEQRSTGCEPNRSSDPSGRTDFQIGTQSASESA
jgi:CheY-like chemotaxis protein